MPKNLTPEQKALIPVYQEKWRQIALSTEPIDRQKAIEAVKAAYALIGEKEPKISFYDSPKAALEIVLSEGWSFDNNEWSPLIQLYDQLILKMPNAIEFGVGYRLANKFQQQMNSQIVQPRRMEDILEQELWLQFESKQSYMWNEMIGDKRELESSMRDWARRQLYQDCIQPGKWVATGSFCDYCISVLNYEPPEEQQEQWETFQLLVKECGWVYVFYDLCLVCDRPRILSFDNQQRLHAEGAPAIQYADGFNVYVHRGRRLSEKYGKVHPHEWRSQWLLEEDNAELRRVLIQGIGYARICQELEAQELDTWQEYTLLKIANNLDIEPIHLLKMICPSTKSIHVLRVPPDVKLAREAIRWVNWGTDPEEFSMQT